MRKIRNRSFFAILIAALVLAGLGIFTVQLAGQGGRWAMLPANQAAFHQGVLNTGTVTDRNGVLLAKAGDGIFRYADDELVRRACLHVAGDYKGFIGTGAVSVFREELTGYDFFNGLSSLEGGGGTVELSIDSALNAEAYTALAGRKGAVVVVNYESGEVLCMVSSPSYDPNTGVDAEAPGMEGVYLNRAISSAFVPGSVFKLVTLTAAIENIPRLFDRSFHCSGSVAVGGELINCTGVHGDQTIEEAFANSCNCAFSELSQELGGDTLEEYAGALGLTESLSLSGIETVSGRFDPAEKGSGELSWSGIGQSTNLVTPYAMARLTAAIANGGAVKEPSILLGKAGGETRIMGQDTAQRLSEMMNYNVAYAYGEGLMPGVTLHAKTGTAEVGDGTSHAWFTGFITGAGLPLAFTVMIENGGGGLANAGPVAARVVAAALAEE